MRLMVETIHSNISLFLADRPHVTVDLESADGDFREFWQWAGAEGDVAAAASEFAVKHNARGIKHN